MLDFRDFGASFGFRFVPERWLGWATSLGVHACAATVLGLTLLPASSGFREPQLATTLLPEADAELDAGDLPSAPAAVNLTVSPDAGGSGSAAWDASAVLGGEIVAAGRALAPQAGVAASQLFGTSDLTGLGRRVRTLAARGDGDGAGSGTGTGTGVGPGSGPGFFGIQPPAATRVVFVVDSSRSMNHPHDSPAKTRFRRVKLELLKCILEMKSDQSFYVVFFSNETTPMPAASLQPARPGVRDPFLKWVGEAPSGGGPTNPLGALELALRLQPDVIYFLTDGEFDGRINRRLLALEQRQTVIHTFAFGETLGEEVLKTLAAHNRGKYQFIP